MSMMIRYCTVSIMIIVVFTGCFPTKLRPWQPGLYTLKEIRQEYFHGNIKETFSQLPYEEKMNICLAAFTQVHPPLMGMLDIFEGSDHASAGKVMNEIIKETCNEEGYISNEEGYIVWMKVQIWKIIITGNFEEYRDECCKILNTLKRLSGPYRDLCIAELEPGCCTGCDDTEEI